MKISSVDVIPITLQLKGVHSNALARYSSSEEVYVRLHSDSGLVGYGSTAPKFYITGETSASVIPVLFKTLIPSVVGMDPFGIGAIHRQMDRAIVGNTSAKTAIDIAVHDLIGKALDVPIYQLLGGMIRSELDAFELVPMGDPAESVAQVTEFTGQGVKQVKLKVGTNSSLDLARVQAVTERFPDLHVKVDANQAWQPKQAIRMCNAFTAMGVDMVEQPVNRRDTRGLAQVAASVDVDIVGDEVVAGPREVLELANSRAVDIFNIKLIKAGGLYRARQMAAIAEAAQMKCMAGATVQSILLDAATAHFMASTVNVDWHEIKGPSWIVNDVVTGLSVTDGKITVPSAPGLGLEFDEQRLERRRLKA